MGQLLSVVTARVRLCAALRVAEPVQLCHLRGMSMVGRGVQSAATEHHDNHQRHGDNAGYDDICGVNYDNSDHPDRRHDYYE